MPSSSPGTNQRSRTITKAVQLIASSFFNKFRTMRTKLTVSIACHCHHFHLCHWQSLSPCLISECPPAMDGMERFACPTPDRQGRYRCIDDHVLCDGFVDCPKGEDEDRQACMFYKTVSQFPLSGVSFVGITTTTGWHTHVIHWGIIPMRLGSTDRWTNNKWVPPEIAL